MFEDNAIIDLTMRGEDLRDQFKIYFQRQNRSTSFNVHFQAIDSIEPDSKEYEFWDGYLGIQPYTFNLSAKEDNFMY